MCAPTDQHTHRPAHPPTSTRPRPGYTIRLSAAHAITVRCAPERQTTLRHRQTATRRQGFCRSSHPTPGLSAAACTLTLHSDGSRLSADVAAAGRRRRCGRSQLGGGADGIASVTTRHRSALSWPGRRQRSFTRAAAPLRPPCRLPNGVTLSDRDTQPAAELVINRPRPLRRQGLVICQFFFL